jgi:hypothetical protein
MPDGTEKHCRTCGQHRERREAWDTECERRRVATGVLIREAIDACDCDDYGRLDDATDCPKHPNFRQYPKFAARKP